MELETGNCMLREKMISILSYLLEVSLYLLPVFFLFRRSYATSIYIWILGFFLLKLFVEKRLPDFRTPITLPVLAFLLAVIIPSLFTTGAGSTWREGKYFIYGIILFLVLTDQVTQRNMLLRRFLWLFFVFSLFLSLDALWQYYYKADWFGNKLWGGRVTAVFSNPNYLGFFMAGVIPIHVFFIESNEKMSAKFFFYILLSLCVVIIVLCGVRSSWCAVIFLYLFWPTGQSIKVIVAKFASILLVLPLGYWWGPSIINKRFIELQRLLNGERFVLWSQTCSMIKDNPIMGSGLDSYKEVSQRAMMNGHKIAGYSFPHFFPLEIWQTSGIIAFMVFFFLLYKIVTESLKYIKSEGKYSFLCFSLLMLFLTSVISIPFFTRYVSFYFWLVLGLLSGAMKREGNPQMESRVPVPEVVVTERQV